MWHAHLSASVETAPGPELTRRGRLVSSRYERLVREARSAPGGDDLSCPFTEEEYDRALKRMNRGAASAGAATAAVLAAPPPLSILNSLWQSLAMPHGFFSSRVHPVYKRKGSRDAFDGYRTVAVGIAEAKLLLILGLRRTLEWQSACRNRNSASVRSARLFMRASCCTQR